MSSLQHYDWRAVYESQPSEDRDYLVENFYRPGLERCSQYDRVAGYFNSGALAATAAGIEAFIENDAEIRLIVGTQLQAHDKPVIEAIQDDFENQFTDVEAGELDGRLEILAWLLHNDRLEIKIAEPKHGNWGVFHPKLGLFHDDDGNTLSFEGSINETKSGWTLNYERFKVHRSWRRGENTYVTIDENSFEELWSDEHPYVDVYDLPEALKQDIIEWQVPDFNFDVETAAKKIKGEHTDDTEPDTVDEATPADYARILSDGGIMPGGLHVAEQAATIDPWPHQRVVSDTAVTTYPQGFLFCDEVGLGKTIEIGFTLSRLYHSNEIQNSLLLVPAGLTRQWQEELWEKFNLKAYRYDRQQTGEYAFIDPFGDIQVEPTRDELSIPSDRISEAWVNSPIWRFVHQRQQHDEPGLVIMSWHTARLTNYWPYLAPGESDDDRTREDVPASCRGRQSREREGVWDVVVVDEAHNARRETNLYRLLEELRPHAQTYYMLTATPMQLHQTELYDLLTLLGLPDEWDDRDTFEQFFQTRRGLQRTLQDIDPDDPLASIETQQTLDGSYQTGLNAPTSVSDHIYLLLRDELDLEDDQHARARLRTACRLARSYGNTYDEYKHLVDKAIQKADLDPFTGEERRLKELLYTEKDLAGEPFIVNEQNRRVALDELTIDGWIAVLDVLKKATPITALLHRNTRDTLRKYHAAGILDETVADRNPERKDITLSSDAEAVYERIDEYTKKFYKKAQEATETQTQALGFVMTTYRQRLTSSIAAIQNSLTDRLEKLERQQRAIERQTEIEAEIESARYLSGFSDEEQLELAQLEDTGESTLGVDVSEIIPGDTEEGLRLISEEIEELRSFIDDVKRIDLDPKIQQLQEDLRELDGQGHDRILVFTQYTDTMDYIREHLIRTHGENVATFSGRGGEMYDADADDWYPVSKEAVKRAFAADEEGIDVLLGTEALSEGLNLQECGAVINYDLPWNPMKVEQRIGRVDRIGQQHPEITIYHYVYDNTIENDIYDALDERIGMFEDVVGNLQPILADVSGNIKSATLEDDETARDRIVAQMDDAEAEATVEIDESLKDVEPVDTATVLEHARIPSWATYTHPDITEIGLEYEGPVPYTTEGVDAAVSTLKDQIDGIEIVSITELDEISSDVPSEFQDQIYVFRFVDSIDSHREIGGKTLAGDIIQHDNEIAVTFNPQIASEYPSLVYCLPGEEIFNLLVQSLREISEPALNFERIGSQDGEQHCEPDSDTPIVAGLVTPSGNIAVIEKDGVIAPIERELVNLTEWCTAYCDIKDEIVVH